MILKKKISIYVLFLLATFLIGGTHQTNRQPGRLEILLLGHTSKHHDSEKLADIFSKEYFKSGINITYTTTPDDLNAATLQNYDGLVLYANYDSITPSQEKALLDFVRGGKGFIPLHCASFCFRNSPEVVELIGGQFKRHKWDSFPAVIVQPAHEVMKGIPAFTTTDETYVHDRISKNIEVLTERVEGDHREPYTWVRKYGNGRVFYTAYGHDDHTFNNKDFLQLVKNGILWAVGDEAKAALQALKMPEPVYTDARLPNYEKRDPAPKFQEPLTPQQSMLLTQVPVGFELQLFAAEPDIINPIYMNWDSRGRLWVIETVDYPNTVMEDKEKGDDRIKIVEDTNGDGRADKFTIFADKLNIPTSFTFANDGIVVAQAPYFLYLKDTNGDDKADARDTVLTGWGTYDTHAGPSNFRYGLDNKLWGTVGYSGFKGRIGADSLKFSQGIIRFTADGKNLEYLSSTSNNTWGLGFSEEFDVFISTANNTHSGFFGIPKKHLDKAGITESGVEKIDAHYNIHEVTKNLRQVDVHGGFTAAAGHSLYTARSFPREYWNRIAFVTEPTGRLIHRHVLEQQGAGFKEKGDGWNMLASADEWAGPIQAEVGPDGSLWVLDWYDFIIQHNPTPAGFENGKGNAYVTPMRDHDRGRIYRIKYKNAKDPEPLSLSKNDPAALASALTSNNMFWRTTAQRLLVESGNKTVLPELYKLVQNEKPDEAGINPPAIHALWTIHGLRALNGSDKEAEKIAVGALSHPSGGVRRAAIQVLPKTPATLQAMTNANVFKDKDLRVRLAALLAISDIEPAASAGNILVDMALNEENGNDAWIRHALLAGVKSHQEGFMAAFRKKGLSETTGLGQVTLIQRLAMASRLKTVSLRSRYAAPAEMSPDVAGKELLISASLEKARGRDYSGLVLAHGDKTNGYGVYIQENRLLFQVNQNGKQTITRSSATLPARFDFTALLQQDGTMLLTVDEGTAVKAKAAGLFSKPLKTGIRVGMENEKGDLKLAPYPDTFRVAGTLANVKLELLEPGSAKQTAASKATTAKADQTVIIKVVKNVMKFDKEVFTVKAGTNVHLILQNPDFMQHNLVIVKPKTLEKVGAAADKLAMDPNGAKLHYVPKMPEVLYATPLINPEGKYTLKFRVPTTAGSYPYICTFPGHWRIMKGVMKVVN